MINVAGVLSFALGLGAITNCAAPRVPLDEIETQLHRQSSDGLTTVKFECGDGEAGWNYVCQALYEPASPHSRTKRRVQRVGVKRMGTYKGAPALSIFPLPNEGPVLTADELVAYRDAQAAEASQARRQVTRKSR